MDEQDKKVIMKALIRDYEWFLEVQDIRYNQGYTAALRSQISYLCGFFDIPDTWGHGGVTEWMPAIKKWMESE